MFGSIFFLLLILKFWTWSQLVDIKKQKAQSDLLINYQLEERSSTTEGLKSYVKSGLPKTLQVERNMKDLVARLDSMERDKINTLSAWEAMFNSSLENNKLMLDSFRYHQNAALSPAENLSYLKYQGYLHLSEGIASEKSEPQSNFALQSVESFHADSIEVEIANLVLPSMDFDWKYKYRGEIQLIDSFPLQLGALDELLKICFTNPHTKKEYCYSKEF